MKHLFLSLLLALITISPTLVGAESSAISSAATATALAVRTGNQEQLTPPPPPPTTLPPPRVISLGDVSIPWYDYSSSTPYQVQRAIDSCIGGILFYMVGSARVFGAHNTACPQSRSFRNSLYVDSIVVDSKSYRLFYRERRLAESPIYPSDIPTLDAVGLQTSINYDVVNISWFIP